MSSHRCWFAQMEGGKAEKEIEIPQFVPCRDMIAYLLFPLFFYIQKDQFSALSQILGCFTKQDENRCWDFLTHYLFNASNVSPWALTLFHGHINHTASIQRKHTMTNIV